MGAQEVRLPRLPTAHRKHAFYKPYPISTTREHKDSPTWKQVMALRDRNKEESEGGAGRLLNQNAEKSALGESWKHPINEREINQP
jgi:hypothetical protein